MHKLFNYLNETLDFYNTPEKRHTFNINVFKSAILENNLLAIEHLYSILFSLLNNDNFFVVGSYTIKPLKLFNNCYIDSIKFFCFSCHTVINSGSIKFLILSLIKSFISYIYIFF